MTPDGKPEQRVLIGIAGEEVPEHSWREAIEYQRDAVPITDQSGVRGWARGLRVDGDRATMLVTWMPGAESIEEHHPRGGRVEVRTGRPWLCPTFERPAAPVEASRDPHGRFSGAHLQQWAKAHGGMRIVELIVGIPVPEVVERLGIGGEG